MTKNTDKYIFSCIVVVFTGIVIAQFIMLTTLFDKYDMLKRNAEYQVKKIYDTAQRVSVNELQLRHISTDIDCIYNIVNGDEFVIPGRYDD